MNRNRIGMILLLAVTVGLLASCRFFGASNRLLLNTMMDTFTETVSAATDDGILEAKGIYGKLNGNGNGIQYFGAALVKKDSVSDPDALISALKEDFEIVEITGQTGVRIESKYLEHTTLSYDTEPGEGEYLTILFFNSSHPASNNTDLAGH